MTRAGMQALGTLALAGCATTPAVPFCGPLETLPPAPPAACREDPAVVDHAERLFDLIAQDAGLLLFRVGFDADARVSAVCAERAPTLDRFTARHDVAERLEQVRALPPGPACLAGHRLDLNESAALRVEVAEALRDCAKEASPDEPVGIDDPRLRRCVLWKQRQRGEIWLFDSLGNVIQVYAERPEATPRRDAIRTCVDADLYILERHDAPPLTIGRRHPRTDTCMRERGWVPVLNPPEGEGGAGPTAS